MIARPNPSIRATLTPHMAPLYDQLYEHQRIVDFAHLHPTSFGTALYRCRRKARLSQREAAQRMGISRVHLSELERSIHLPSPATARSCIHVLRLSMNDVRAAAIVDLMDSHNEGLAA